MVNWLIASSLFFKTKHDEKTKTIRGQRKAILYINYIIININSIGIMNKLEEQLAKIIEKAMEVAEQSGQFVIDQAPDLLQQFYKWHISKSILMIIIFIGMVYLFRAISLQFGIKEESNIPDNLKNDYIKKPDGRFYLKTYSYDNESNSYYAYRVFNTLKYLWLLGVAHWAYNLVFIIVAPKLYLIEYFLK